jgi:UvrB/uvrC motif.
LKIEQLREEQHCYAEQEDFDRAAEIQQQIRDLVRSGDDFKYQHPLLDQKVFI